MKKVLSLILVLAMLTAFAAGCGSSGSESAAPDAAPAAAEEEGGEEAAEATGDAGGKIIGISMSTQTQARQLKDVEYLTKELNARGYDVSVQYAEMDPTKQVAQIETFISQNVDGIIISAWDAESLSSVVDTAAANKIPVICYDMLVSNTENVAYYVTDNLYDCGQLQGNYIINALDLDNADGPFNIELFSGDRADSNAPYFFNGAVDALQPYIDNGKLVVVSGQTDIAVTATPDWDGLKAQDRMDTILSTYYADKKIDAVMCNNDAIALGVLASLKNAGYGTADKPYPVITGMDCDMANIKSILADEVSMTVFKDNRIIAAKAAEVMDCVVKGETPTAGDAFETTFNNGVADVTAFLIAPQAIDKNNAMEVLFDSGYYEKSQLDN